MLVDLQKGFLKTMKVFNALVLSWLSKTILLFSLTLVKLIFLTTWSGTAQKTFLARILNGMLPFYKQVTTTRSSRILSTSITSEFSLVIWLIWDLMFFSMDWMNFCTIWSVPSMRYDASCPSVPKNYFKIPISFDLPCFAKTSCILLTSALIHSVCYKKFYIKSLTSWDFIFAFKYSSNVIESYFDNICLYFSFISVESRTVTRYSSDSLSIYSKNL